MTDDVADEQRDHQGRLMLPLSPSQDSHLLRRAGEVLEHDVGALTQDRFSSPDDVFWDYLVRGVAMSLYWQRGTGLWLVAGDDSVECERQLRALAVVLRPRLG